MRHLTRAVIMTHQVQRTWEVHRTYIMRRLTRAVFGGLLTVLVAGCAGGSPSPVATVTVPPPSPMPYPTGTPKVVPTWTPTGTPTSTPTSAPTAALPTRTPTSTPTPLPPTPTPSSLSSLPVPQPQVPISPADADRVTQLARWGDRIVTRVAYSPDGRFLALASSVGVHLYDAETLEKVGFLNTETSVEGLAFSPDAAHLVSGGGGAVQLWRVTDGALLYTLRGHKLENQAIGLRGLAFSPDGGIIATASHYDQVRLWRVTDGVLLRTLEGPDTWVEGVAFSPDGELVASASGKRVWLWRASDGKLMRVLQGETYWSGGVAFSPDGKLLTAAAGNSLVWLWRLSDGAVLHKLNAHLTGLAFSPDGTTLALGSMNGTVRLWRVSDGALLHTLSGHTRGASVAFSPDGKTMASASADGAVHLWRAEDGTLERTIGGYAPWAVHTVALSPDGTTLAVGTGDSDVRLWRVSDGVLLRTLEGHTSAVSSVAFSPDGALLASGSRDNNVRLWRLEDGGPRYTLRGHRGDVGSVAFSPNGTLLASGGADEEEAVRLWQVEDGELLGALEGQSAHSLAFSPDGTTLAAGIGGGLVRLWRVTECTPTLSQDSGGEESPSRECGTHLQDLAMDGAKATSVVFSPDGAILAAAGDGRVWLWQMADGTPWRILAGHTGKVERVAFSPDGTVLASGADDGALRLWRASDGALLRTLKGHTEAVTGLALASEGVLLVSGSADGTVRFWGVAPAPAVAKPVPTPISTPWPTPEPPSQAGGFGRVTSADGLPRGEIHHLWVAPDGHLWLTTEAGIFAHADDEWLPLYEGLANRVLGADSAGRVWAVVNEGWHVAAYADATWVLYGPDQGWSRGYGGALVTDRRGWVWMATGGDLRRFDPQVQTAQAWTIFSPTDIGFEPLGEPLDPGHILTDVALDGAGNVWVGNCIQAGILIQGQGVRWFDGERWSGSVDAADECVCDIEVDAAGRVWISGFNALVQYDPAAQAWSRFPLTPSWERPQLITSVTLDPAGNPWVTFVRFSPVGPWGPTALYHLDLDDGAWVADYDPGDEVFINLTFGPDGAAWMCANGTVYRLAAGQREEIGTLGHCGQIAVDGAGRVWIIGMGRDPALWLLEPGE